MYRPSKYDEHNKSLNRFIQLVNSKNNPKIKMDGRNNENYRDDGVIISDDDKEIIFDWEKRDTHWTNKKFPFPTLGQFERKLMKPNIQLSIQCNKGETEFAIGWHENWLKENSIPMSLATDDPDKNEQGTVRYTQHFRVYTYHDVDQFIEVLIRAFENNTFNHKSFNN